MATVGPFGQECRESGMWNLLPYLGRNAGVCDIRFDRIGIELVYPIHPSLRGVSLRGVR
jgi:hypothetical protein